MTRVDVRQKVLGENDRIAQTLRAAFKKRGALCLNILGSPGAGKTSLLERTLERLDPRCKVAVLTGDLETENDAQRLARYGFPTRQITTGGSCHLDARMVEKALADWDLERIDLLFIENVGNLVCPSSFDLGETAKIVVLSTAEGDDKPLKYPGTMLRCRLLVLNKLDLLPYVSFGIEAFRENARRVHPGMEQLELSCTTAEGLDAWCAWVETQRQAAVSADAR